MTENRLKLQIEGDIARLTLCREEKRNALDEPMVDALLPLCRKIEHSTARVLIVTGEGNRAFSAGGDINAWSDCSAQAFGRHWVRDGHSAFDALARLSQPVIAVLNGDALGGGLELAACADLRIAERHVKLGQPEAGLGIIPGWSGTQRAVRRFGAQTIRRLALFGEILDAQQALQLGLVDQIVETGNGLVAAEQLADRVINRSARATELSKMLINAAEGEECDRVLESLAGAIAAASDELQEGLQAFAQKRNPRFKELENDLTPVINRNLEK